MLGATDGNRRLATAVSMLAVVALLCSPAVGLADDFDFDESDVRIGTEPAPARRAPEPAYRPAEPRTTEPPAPPTGAVQDPGTLGLSFGFDLFGGMELLASILGTPFVPTVGGAYFLNETAALRLEVGLGLTVRPGSDFAFLVGTSYRGYHMGMAGKVAPYFEPGGSIAWINEILFLRAFFNYGAEYFFTDQLSLGGSIGLQVSLVDGADLVEFFTARSGVQLTVYW